MKGISDKNAASLVSLKKTYEIAGEQITFETGKLGLLINGAVTISDTNDNILFVTTGFKTKGLNENADFFPLVVDFQEKFYATGKIGGNRFQKREGRPSDSATLTSRLIDRPIRPMFPKGIINDTQVIATVLSASGEKELGFWGIIGASLGLMMA
jgi:polyribonucleotide nucleotidyltransferase